MQPVTNRAICTIAAFIFVSVASVFGERIDRITLPDGVFYYKPAASVFGSEAAWINPAGLSRYHASSFQLMADYADDSFGKSWGTVISREQLAVAYRYLDNPQGKNYREYVFASSVPLGKQFYVGGSYRYFKDGPDYYNKRHFWNVGLIGQTGGPLSWAALFSNLNRGEVDGQRTETEQRYSLSYRPTGKAVTLSVDMFLSTKTRLKNADFIYHLEVIPYRGLYVEGYLDSDKNFQVGVRANLLQYFVGSQSSFRKGEGHHRTTAFVGATNLRQPSLIPEPKRRLSIDLSGQIPENPPRPFLGRQPTSFVTLITTIYRASEDPAIREMVLGLKDLSLGFGQAQELREAIEFFKSKNKSIVCHLSFPNNIAYFVASAADSILISPVSQLNLVGLRAELTFYAGTLDKLGVKADLVRVGDYKSATEQYTQKAASEENREQINRLLDNIYGQFVAAIAEGRGISADSVRRIIDGGPYTSAEALEFGLVDGLSYRDELKEDFLSSLPEISFRQYLGDTLANDGWPAEPVLAVVVAEGDIEFEGRSVTPFDGGDKVTPASMKQAFECAAGEPQVKGIIFRIDSPGGLALAGEEIYHDAAKTAEKKLLVTSMSNVAASGGYYVITPSEHLFANPGTITGSIGIYGGTVDLSNLYEKIDLGKELYTRGKFAGLLSTVRPFTEVEREKYYSHLKAFYDHFVNLVASNRSLSVDSIDALSQGKVWTGQEALSNGLIDETGGLKQTLDYTAAQLGLKDYRIAVYPEKRSWLAFPGRSFIRALARFFSSTPGKILAESLDLQPTGEVFARMPYDISIK
jgi:protease-4